VLSKLPLDRPDAREKVEKILSGLKWPQFPGLHSLLIKVDQPIKQKRALPTEIPIFGIPIVLDQDKILNYISPT
jgi:hypothetical protein